MISDKEIAKKWEQITGKEIPAEKLKRLRKICESIECDYSDPFFTLTVITETQGGYAASEIREAYASGQKGLTRDVQDLRLEVITAIARKASATIEDAITRETKAKLLQWTLIGVIVVSALFTSVGYFVYKQGFDSGYINGVGEVHYANEWVKLPEGIQAYKNRFAIKRLLDCDLGRNWEIKDGACFPFEEDGKVAGWPIQK